MNDETVALRQEIQTPEDFPKTLSGLLRLAVADAQKCEADPKFRLDMGKGVRSTDGICKVCLAGAVLSQTCGVSNMVEYSQVPHWARGIDYMRSGSLRHAYAAILGRYVSDTDEERDILRAGLLIVTTFDVWLQRAPFSVYLEAAQILEDGGL